MRVQLHHVHFTLKTNIRKYYYVRGFPPIKDDDDEGESGGGSSGDVILENSFYTRDNRVFKTYDGKIFLIKRMPASKKKIYKKRLYYEFKYIQRNFFFI